MLLVLVMVRVVAPGTVLWVADVVVNVVVVHGQSHFLRPKVCSLKEMHQTNYSTQIQ